MAGASYLNFQQAPNAYLPRPDFTFRVTSGRSSTPAVYADEYQPYPLPASEIHVANGKLSVSPSQGPVGAQTMLRGEGFPADTTLDLFWQTYVGSRVSGNGFAPQEKQIAKVKVGSDGKIEFPLTIPLDLGGQHGLELRDNEKPLGARLLCNRDQHREHGSCLGSCRNTDYDSLAWSRLDGVRQPLCGDVR